jgi:tRNA 5-methylaminomethyl-2-thiouridine biosynthesis bifunctional protein
VTLVEKQSGPAMEASGIPTGLLRPVFSLDWNLHSRVTVASYFYGLRHLDALADAGHPVTRGEGGALQLSRDAENFAKQREIVKRFLLPEELVRIVDAAQAGALAGMEVAGPGWWFPDALWASPASVCHSNIAVCGDRLFSRFDTEVAALRKGPDSWELCDAAGQIIAAAPMVVLANAQAATRFTQARWLPLRSVRGQITFIPKITGLSPRLAVAREGYITPAVDGMHCLGASFNEGVDDPSERLEDHESNLRRLDAMLPGIGSGFDAAALHGRVAFRTMATDRLPVLGALASVGGADAELAGLYCCLALGSRGMTWGALAAEIVASAMEGDPMPLERELLRALSPRRFLGRGGLSGTK